MTRGPLLDHLDELEEKFQHKDPTLQEITEVFKADGHYILIVFLVIPFLQPVPLMGLSAPFGALIGLVGLRALLKKAPWIPSFWAKKTVSSKTILIIAETTERIVEKISFLMKPRWTFFFRPPFNGINAGVLLLNAFLLALPLPIPLSNAMPAWAILFQALANLEEDGVLVFVSYLQSAATLAFFFFLSEAVQKLFSVFTA